jgi:hypothetical protein
VKIAQSLRPSFWRREHHLDKMSLRELVVAYVQYPAIIAYFPAAAVAIGFDAWRPAPLAPTLAAIAAATFVYPLVWYLLHRWVLHSRWMWRHRLLASTWKRIHYDHHQDPNHLEVLFGALHTTMPTIAIATLPIGYAIGMRSLRPTTPRRRGRRRGRLRDRPPHHLLLRILPLHPAPRLQAQEQVARRDEAPAHGPPFPRRERQLRNHQLLLGPPARHLLRPQGPPEKSPTVFNLGYTNEVAEKYPHVARLSGGVATGHPRQRGRVADAAPELIDLNREEIAARHGKGLAGPEAMRPPVTIRPVIDTPLAIAC